MRVEPDGSGAFGPSPVSGLASRRSTREGGSAGEVDALVGQHRHDTRRRLAIGKARLIGYGQKVRVRPRSAHGLVWVSPPAGRTTVTSREAAVGLPTPESAQVDADHRAGTPETGAAVCAVWMSGPTLGDLRG
ncbi:MAG: hypothetical protein IPL29_09180 [Propionivibrio sp.]|nr:hypothetical protein [Propionivibrio sp.]